MTPAGQNDSNSATVSRSQSRPQKRGKQVWKRTFRVIAILLLAALTPYLISRFSAPKNRIRIFAAAEKEQPLDSTSEIPSQSTFKIVAYNIAHGRGPTVDNWEEAGKNKAARVAKIADFLKELDADVVVLNEVDFDSSWSGRQNQASSIAERAGYRFHVEQRNLDFGFYFGGSWSFGNAILSKHPISKTAVVDFPPLKEWEDWLVGCKRGVVCQINPPGQPPFRVVAVHLEHRSEPVRVQSSKQLIDLIEQSDVPLIAAGDFNSTPAGYPQSNQTGENALDVLIASEKFQVIPNSPPNASELTFSSYDPKSTIDWIMLPPGWIIESYAPVDSDLSDHRPVVASFAMNVSDSTEENTEADQ